MYKTCIETNQSAKNDAQKSLIAFFEVAWLFDAVDFFWSPIQEGFFSQNLWWFDATLSLIPFADSFYHTRHHLIAHWSTRMAELNLEVLSLNHNVCYQTPLILFIICLTWMSAEAWVSLAFLTSLPLMKRIRSILSRRPSCSVVEPSWMSEIQKKHT